MQTKKLLLMAICLSVFTAFAKPPQGNMPNLGNEGNHYGWQNNKGCSGQHRQDEHHHGGHHKKKGGFHGQYNGNSQNHQNDKPLDDKNKGQNFK